MRKTQDFEIQGDIEDEIAALREENRIELTGLDCLRLLSAFQALRMPSKFYGVTHKQARDIIEQLTGKRPKGKPETSGDLEHYLSWHLGCEVKERAVPLKSAAELGLTEEELAAQTRLADEIAEEIIAEERGWTAEDEERYQEAGGFDPFED